ncbi:MAG: DNA translocase FtsK [Treponema sp.]|nr:DNA translocase FtsK [Treponema sp.]
MEESLKHPEISEETQIEEIPVTSEPLLDDVNIDSSADTETFGEIVNFDNESQEAPDEKDIIIPQDSPLPVEEELIEEIPESEDEEETVERVLSEPIIEESLPSEENFPHEDTDFAEPVIEESIPVNEEDFHNDFDEMEDVRPVALEDYDMEEIPEADDATEDFQESQDLEDSPEEISYEEDFQEAEEFQDSDEFSNDEEDFQDDIIEEEIPEMEIEAQSEELEEFADSEEFSPELEEEDENPADSINLEDISDGSTEVFEAEEDEEPFGVEDIFSQMEEDAAENPVIKNHDELPVRDSLYQPEMDAPDLITEEDIAASEKAQAEAKAAKFEAEAQKTNRKLSEYKIPSDLLEKFENEEYWLIDDETKTAGENLKQTLNEFGIEAEVTGIRKGPVVTMFELLPAPGVKLSKIVNLQDNIALALAAKSVRIVAPIPGKHAVGIEIPNKERAIVSFREIIEQNLPEFKKMAIPVILGKDISGQSQIIDIAKTPHLLIAGATGAGKSVCVNSIILSILYNRSPRDVKLIMVDPKVVELKLYNDIPHLLTPVVTEPKRALQVLQYCICEMERRYALLDSMGVRDIVSYNNRIRERKIATEKLPYIVVIIDEFADLMATSGKELESNVARLTAMSRAVGIHLVLATQRPSVNVITGLIKANIPSRIAFMVASRTDSNIIIDGVGAEKLLGKGDMLYTSAVNPIPTRIQGTLVSDNEVENVVDYVKTFGGPDYIDDEIFVDDEDEDNEPGLFSDGEDPLYDQALQIVVQAGKASASYIQRRLKIGYNRAARLVEDMEARGIVGPANGSKPREVIHMP